MRYLRMAFGPRYIALTLSAAGIFVFAGFTGSDVFGDLFAFLSLACIALVALGVRDLVQTRHAVLRNYPISAHLRFLLEDMRPAIRQYFFEDEKQGAPFSRDARAIVYQRAKKELDKRPFGTEYDVYAEGYEFARHSIAPAAAVDTDPRVLIGQHCAKPYSASLFNISAMSFGALSANAIRALNAGARRGGFAHDTGEGGVSPYHLENGGDLVWEIGSGYFGCRDQDGAFSPDQFAAVATAPQIRMIEVKLSQGAKPGQGGILPAAKLTPEISEIRRVPLGRDCVSPARHTAFSTPIELLQFIERLRTLSGGKPTGFKLCIGHPWEFLAICKAMVETGLAPDFIVIDGKEGGTGAAPLEFMDHIGMPMREGLNFAHNALVGVGVRPRVRLGASGKIVSGFDMARAIALGADWCNAARGFMFALGCIQSQACHTDACPTGVATQDESRSRALVVPDKSERVFQFHRQTVAALKEIAAAVGASHPCEIATRHLSRRISPGAVVDYDALYPALRPRALLEGSDDPRFVNAWRMAQAHSFAPAL